MTQTEIQLLNPYWDTVSGHIRQDDMYGGPCVYGYRSDGIDRHDTVGRYAWTISDPDTVAFIAEHAGPRVLDPLCGAGYWAWLLGQLGADVLAYDKAPPDQTKNTYHPEGVVHVPVLPGDAADGAAIHSDRTLLLSWPPYGDPLGADVLRAYGGDRVIYIGEGIGGCCGDDDMFELLATEWRWVAEHRPVQWWGIHDYVTVYERSAR